jgi:hypothetical protein
MRRNNNTLLPKTSIDSFKSALTSALIDSKRWFSIRLPLGWHSTQRKDQGLRILPGVNRTKEIIKKLTRNPGKFHLFSTSPQNDQGKQKKSPPANGSVTENSKNWQERLVEINR